MAETELRDGPRLEVKWELLSRPAPAADDLGAVLADLARGRGLGDGVLVGTADDGVIWGRLRGGRVALSRDARGADGHPLAVGGSLCWVRLQGLRLFSERGELRLSRRAGALWQATVAEVPEGGLVQDARHPLIGRVRGAAEQGEVDGVTFTRLRGGEGEVHAPPLLVGAGERCFLTVRRYYELDAAGLYRLSECRYLTLTKEASDV